MKCEKKGTERWKKEARSWIMGEKEDCGMTEKERRSLQVTETCCLARTRRQIVFLLKLSCDGCHHAGDCAPKRLPNTSRVFAAFTSPLFSFPVSLHTLHCHLWTSSSFYGLLTRTRSLPRSHLQCITSWAVITPLPFPLFSPPLWCELAGLKPQVSSLCALARAHDRSHWTAHT